MKASNPSPVLSCWAWGKTGFGLLAGRGFFRLSAEAAAALSIAGAATGATDTLDAAFLRPVQISAGQGNDKATVPILIATLRGADYMNFDSAKIYTMILVAIVPIVIIYTIS